MLACNKSVAVEVNAVMPGPEKTHTKISKIDQELKDEKTSPDRKAALTKVLGFNTEFVKLRGEVSGNKLTQHQVEERLMDLDKDYQGALASRGACCG